MIDAVTCLAGLALVQALGAVLRRGTPFLQALRSPGSAWLGFAVVYAVSLGLPGLLLLAAGLAAARVLKGTDDRPLPVPLLALAVLAAVVLARPWVPTYWDEFVWLAKARLESLAFGAGAQAALDPAQKIIPQGYPSLWPAAVGWLSLGRDALGAHVLGATALLLLCAASAIEVWHARLKPSMLPLIAVLAVPLVWVHLRATYLDLPVGLLGLALLGHLLQNDGQPSRVSIGMAVVLVAIKDDGLAHVLAATGAALLAGTVRSWRQAVPAAVALIAVGLWKWLTHQHGTASVDHAFDGFAWPWIPALVKLFAVHATDVFSWGVFWAVALAALVLPDPRLRPLRAMIVLLVLLMAGALLTGPERVRVFAENGTLLNRLLLQLWPAAAAALLVRTADPIRSGSRST